MLGPLAEMFQNRLRKVDKHYSKLARRKSVTCFRIYDRDLPEFPFCIERFEDSLVVWKYLTKKKQTPGEVFAENELALIAIEETLEIPRDKIHFKVRKRKAGQSDQYQKLSNSQSRSEVSEGGLVFRVNLNDYLDTGLFLDHRETRKRVRSISSGKRVLNLFCYTGSFSVYAADGRAASVTSVDLSNSYLKHAEGNMKVNGLLDPAKHRFIKSDVMKFLENEAKESFDLVILDPPTFSNSKSMDGTFDVQRDHVRLIRDVLELVSDGGLVIFSTNCRNFQFDKESFLTGQYQNCHFRDTTKASIPFDFQNRCQRYCFDITKK